MNGTDLTATATISNIPLNMNGIIISCSTSGVTGTFNNYGESQYNRFDIINTTNYTVVVKTLSNIHE